ncbi:hypothetical protein Acr_05g0013240 [Actinidia rufa]|uniref:DUF4283 domain-containing protein n=1 Tax=Actinidia rufa TaxID=165716 RepID=A0A7J0EMG9_9ERIC|nr:hypothetical protein Acr_05g0013240 [Actinidia rufa]
MVRTKNKHKEGGQGPSSKLEENPILTTELARSAKDSHEGGTKASSSPPIRHMVIDGRSLAVMFDDGDEAVNAIDTDTPKALNEDSDQGTEGDPSEKYSDDTSQSLGDGDPTSTQCVRQNAQEDSVNTQSKPSAAAGDKNKDNGSQDKKKVICKRALNQIVASWKVHPTIIFHDSGWIVFQFSSIEDQDAVLDNGPYMIYGCPLLLKSMDKYFNFGKPIHMDKLTTQKERVTYARCLVEIDMAKKLVHSVDLLLPEAGVHQQMIYYENLPKYCPLCKMVGHTKENCKSITKPTNKAAEPNIASSDQGPRGAAGQPSGMVAKGGVQPAIQKEWVPKQPDPYKDNNASAVAISLLTMEIIPVNHEPNKASIPEPNPEPISEFQSLPIELNPVNITEHIPESNPIPPPEPNREPISKANLEPSSVSPPKGLNQPLKQNGVLKHLKNIRFNSIHHHPWILLGDFNNVLSNGERINGMPVTTYEIREFKECCYDLGLSDLRSTGAFFTWTNNSVWCKLDRVMVNNEWTQRVVRSSWDLYVEGTAMFRLCKKLKTLEDPLKSLNKLHFSHISTRSAAAEEELQQAQQQLHNNLNDSELQAAIPILRAKALKLAKAEMSFYSQIAKSKISKEH